MFLHPAEQDASSTRWGGSTEGEERERESQPLIVLGRERFEGAIEREKLVSWWKDAAAGKSENPVSCADDDCG